MTTKQRIEHIESKIDVEKLSVSFKGKDFQIYPWLKGRFFHKIITGNETLHQRNFKFYWKQALSFFYGILNILGKYDIWAFSASTARTEINGKNYDRFFDQIGNELGYKMLLIELRVFKFYPYSSIASKKAMSKSFFMVFEEIYGRLFVRNYRIKNSHVIHQIEEEINDVISYDYVVRKYIAQYKMMKFWLKVLPKPKTVLMVVSYTNFGYVRAFKEAGIPVIELQHGVITKNHQAYYYKKSFDAIQFPDYLYTVGEKELDVFDTENTFPTSKIEPVGSMILDFYASKNVELRSKGTQILFTLQDGVMAEKLLKFILELKRKFPNYIFPLVQPRRGEKSDYLSNHPELEEVHFSTKSFYNALIETDIHCTVYSTTAIEALTLGKPNILVNIDNQSIEQLGESLGSNQYTKIVDNTEEFIKALKELTTVNSEEIIASNRRNVYPNFKQNIKEKLDKLIYD